MKSLSIFFVIMVIIHFLHHLWLIAWDSIPLDHQGEVVPYCLYLLFGSMVLRELCFSRTNR